MRLTARQREVLLEHVDRPGGVPVRADSPRMVPLLALLEAGLLRADRSNRPRRTFATEAGREEICGLLGQEADSLSSDLSAKFGRKLSVYDAEQIRRRGRAGEGREELAVAFEISVGQVNNVLAGRSWNADRVGRQTRAEDGSWAPKAKRRDARIRDRNDYMKVYRRRRREAARSEEEGAAHG